MFLEWFYCPQLAWAVFDVSKTQNYRIMAYFDPCYLDVYITTEWCVAKFKGLNSGLTRHNPSFVS